MLRLSSLVGVAIALACSPAGAWTDLNLMPNPSFEAELQGWSGAAQVTADAHSGSRALLVAGGYASSPVLHPPMTVEYRLGAWVRCAEGAGQIALAHGEHLSALAPIADIRAAAGWQYIAGRVVLPRPAKTARLLIRAVKSLAIDDLHLWTSTNLLKNGDFEETEAFRNPGPGTPPQPWRERTPWGWRPEWGAGMFALAPARMSLDAEAASSARSLLVRSPGRWGAVSSETVILPGAGCQVQCSARVRLEPGAQARLGVLYYGPMGLMQHLMSLPAAADGEWQTLEVGQLVGSTYLDRLRVALEVNGAARFDDVRLFVVAKEEPEVRAWVNQVGYETDSPKAFVVGATEWSAGQPAAFDLVSESGQVVLAGAPLKAVGRIHEARSDDWGYYFFTGDFTNVMALGRYRIKARIGSHEAESCPFDVQPDLLTRATAELAYRFFFYQRCGGEVPGLHKPCHMDDGRLPDGSHLDVTGGWHDAGDYNKYFGFTPFAAYSLMHAYDENPAFYDQWDLDKNGRADILDEGEWGAAFMKKMQDPQTGGLYNCVSTGYGFWGAPEKETDNIPGTADDRPIFGAPGNNEAAYAAAAFAALARWSDPAAAADYLQRAQRLYQIAGGGSGGGARNLLAAMELFLTTRDQTYANDAASLAASMCEGTIKEGSDAGAFGSPGSPAYSIIDQGLYAGALATLIDRVPDTPVRQKVLDALSAYADWSAKQTQNAFELFPLAPGEVFFNRSEGWNVGQNSQYLSQAWAMTLVARLTGSEAAKRQAVRLADWVLGCNPTGFCMMEGVGSNNIPRYHHRYSGIPGFERGAVSGCVPNGITRPSPEEDKPFMSLTADYQSAEPWLPHNSYYVLFISAHSRS
jgi:hypothetical protein